MKIKNLRKKAMGVPEKQTSARLLPKSKNDIVNVHEMRTRNELSCRNCVYASMCAQKPYLRQILYKVAPFDHKPLTQRADYVLFDEYTK